MVIIIVEIKYVNFQYYKTLRSEGSPEGLWMDGRFQDEDDYQERKQQEASQREKRHLEHFSTVGAEITHKHVLSPHFVVCKLLLK